MHYAHQKYSKEPYICEPRSYKLTYNNTMVRLAAVYPLAWFFTKENKSSHLY